MLHSCFRYVGLWFDANMKSVFCLTLYYFRASRSVRIVVRSVLLHISFTLYTLMLLTQLVGARWNFPFVGLIYDAVCLLLGASDGHSHDWFGFLSRISCQKCAHQDFLQLHDLHCGQLHPAFAGHRFCRLRHSAINQSFRRSSFHPPKAKVLEPDVRIHAPVPSGWRACNVQGDGRCGYRALAKFLGISWTDVMQRLLPLMLAAQQTFQPHELMAFVMAMGPANPCSRAAWLSHCHILLLSQQRDWFLDGIAVRKKAAKNSLM